MYFHLTPEKDEDDSSEIAMELNNIRNPSGRTQPIFYPETTEDYNTQDSD